MVLHISQLSLGYAHYRFETGVFCWKLIKDVVNLENNALEKEKQTISFIQRNIDVITAILLLTGQITIIGVFVTPGGFRISIGGPLTGISRLEGKQKNRIASWFIDIIDIIIAALLIHDQIRVLGTFTSSKRFTLTVSGPIFGVSRTEPSALSQVNKEFNSFQKIVSQHFYVDPALVEKLTKE
jgi:hypothetical protein